MTRYLFRNLLVLIVILGFSGCASLRSNIDSNNLMEVRQELVKKQKIESFYLCFAKSFEMVELLESYGASAERTKCFNNRYSVFYYLGILQNNHEIIDHYLKQGYRVASYEVKMYKNGPETLERAGMAYYEKSLREMGKVSSNLSKYAYEQPNIITRSLNLVGETVSDIGDTFKAVAGSKEVYNSLKNTNFSTGNNYNSSVGFKQGGSQNMNGYKSRNHSSNSHDSTSNNSATDNSHYNQSTSSKKGVCYIEDFTCSKNIVYSYYETNDKLNNTPVKRCIVKRSVTNTDWCQNKSGGTFKTAKGALDDAIYRIERGSAGYKVTGIKRH
jgi:hypothetical protein